jgi:serine/threonine-protein kinase
MLRCAHCSEALPDSARFCPSCGTPASSLSQMPTAVPAARPHTPSSDSVSRLPSPSSLPGGFAPGVVLGERYRIIGLLGRGGMGEIYRADDLRLGQPVALKFLRKSLAQDAALLEHFRGEVRNARQVSHPNVCRVYDIGELDGQHFLSMEYVDGEDLATLLRRIGRLPAAKALEIARQLCAGLAAAHERHVLHRDLKPSNVMLDGHGRVRITDFGLAVEAEGAAAEGGLAGTPAYMSPEQTEGKPATPQSDLYALGLVLYEVFTGKKAFEATSFAEWRRKHTQETPTAPSVHVADVEAAVERAILRCLEKDPAKRPQSALQLAASLPGGDPLAAALAAGETPSPEMVAASGEAAGLRSGAAWMLVGAMVMGVVGVTLLNPKTTLLQRMQVEKSPEAMAERARQFIGEFVYARPPVDSLVGMFQNSSYLQHIQLQNKSTNRWDQLDPAALVFWYRQSPYPLLPEFHGATIAGPNDPPVWLPGEVLMYLDARGRLTGLTAVPPQKELSPATGSTPNWKEFLVEAGYDPAQFKPVEPQWPPRFYADTRMAWEPSSPTGDGVLRIEAGAYRDKVVHFLAVRPDTTPRRENPLELPPGAALAIAIGLLWMVLVLAGGLWFAIRNLRLGRGDRRGAVRLAVFGSAVAVAADLLSVHHVAALPEISYLTTMLSVDALAGLVIWVLYIALEPTVRRRWPHLLVSWTRLLAGGFRDPLVGRDILIGCVAGALVAVAGRLEILVPGWIGFSPPQPLAPSFALFNAPRGLILTPLWGLFEGAFKCLAVVFALTFFRVILRRQWAAVGLLLLLFVAAHAAGKDPFLVAVAFGVLIWGIAVAVLARWGLTALLATWWMGTLLDAFPLTLQGSAWYAGMGQAGLLVIAAVTLYGFYTSLGGKPIFGGATLDD